MESRDRARTFLFADIAGFTALTEVMGDQEAVDVAEAFFDGARALLAEHGATEVKTIGDAHLMADCPAGDDDDVSILGGVGDGTFQPRVDYPTGDSPRSVAVGDFDRDGRKDLAVGNYFAFGISILEGKADGTFKPKVDYETGYNPQSIAVGDFDRDRRPVLAVATGGDISILINDD